MATLRDIAQAANLSPKAVSFAINGTGRLAPETRKRVLEIARDMNYHPNQAARALVLKKSHLIGVVMPHADTSFFPHILAGLEEIAGRHGYALLLVDATDDADADAHAWTHRMRHRIDGLVVTPTPEAAEYCLRLVEDTGAPVVQLMEADDRLGQTGVRVDNAGGVRAALRHLADLGHRRIGLLHHDAERAAALCARRAAYDDFMAERGLAGDPGMAEDAALSYEGGQAAAARLLARTPDLTALFACSDYAALGAIRTLVLAGRRVPEDVSVVGFDDIPEASRQTVHPLTTVAQPKTEIGIAAGQLLLSMIEGQSGESMRLPTSLIVRSTTAPAKA